MSEKLIFIGFDSSEPDLVCQWAEQGLLPNTRELLGRGAWGSVSIPRGMGNGAVWPTLFTGVNPARHGRYFARQFDPATYRVVQFNDDCDFRREPFWLRVSDARRKVAVIDVGHAPLRTFNGIQIADWLTHDQELPSRSHPPELIKETIARFGADPLNGNSDSFGVRPTSQCERLRDQTIERARTKAALACDLLRREPWELFMVSFHEPHDLGHQCWHLHDPSHPHHDARWVRRHSDPIRQLYVELDRCVGDILRAAEPAATIALFFGPGMESNFNADEAVDTLLVRLEATYAGRSPTAGEHLRSIYHRYVPDKIRERLRLRERFAAPHRTDSSEAPRPILSHRKFFAVPHNQNAGAVRFNLVGRERYGVVHPGVEYDALCKRLTDDLLGIVNAQTGRPLIREVVDVSRHCRGEHRDVLPDLLLLWSREAPIRAVQSPLVGRVKVTDPSSRTGDHTQHALFLVAGPNIVTSRFPESARVEDIAPTLAMLVGVSLDDVDGSALPLC